MCAAPPPWKQRAVPHNTKRRLATGSIHSASTDPPKRTESRASNRHLSTRVHNSHRVVSIGGWMVSKMGSIHTMRCSSIPAGKGGIQSPHLRCPHLPSLQGGSVNSTTSTQHWEPTGSHSGTPRLTELPLTGKHQDLGNFPRLISS